MAIDEEDDFKVDGHQSIGELRKRLYSHFARALGTDYQQPEQPRPLLVAFQKKS